MGMKTAYMVVGCPGSGKSWVCERLGGQYTYVRHDDHIGGNYVKQIILASEHSTKPLLIETPFSMSQILEPLSKNGFTVHCVFIQEPAGVIEKRYLERDKKPLPVAHMARQRTYAERAKAMQAFSGTSFEVLAYLKDVAPAPVVRFPWES